MNHQDDGPLPGMVGRHASMLAVYRQVRCAAQSELPALIVGETGTGKELVARALHELGPTPYGRFVDVNCAALPEGLAEAELFGAERGAFTGAVRRVIGFLEAANGGTLFLDEACSLSPGIQAKLLRAIEHKMFYPIGGRTPRRSRFRLIAAVGAPVAELIAGGSLRSDFAYRLAGFTITLPPLRARRSDIPLLAEHFLQGAGHDGHPPAQLASDALALLRRQSWPGNVRELKMLMERLAAIEPGPVIELRALLAHGAEGAPGSSRDPERVVAVLVRARWNVTIAAQLLGVSRATLKRRLREYGIRRPPRTVEVVREPVSLAHEPLGRSFVPGQPTMP